jgi:hypothetical protein
MAKSVKASEFKAKCLALFDEVAETRQPLIVSKSVARLVDELDPNPGSSFPAGTGAVARRRDGGTSRAVRPPG